MSSYLSTITSPLRGKAAPRSQSFPVNALSEQETSKGCSDMLQERSTATGASNNLFYTYARRVCLIPNPISHTKAHLRHLQTDNHASSRYVLVFDTADTCDDWWKLVQREYPSQCQRIAPQLFSFTGDAFPSKIAANKKFEHLKPRWFYCQIGDANSTSGRGLEVLPLQDGRGFPIAAAHIPVAATGAAAAKRLSMGRESIADDDQERGVYAYEEGLRSMEGALEKTATHMAALAEGQKMGQDALHMFVDRQMAGEEHVNMLAERIETQSTLQERLLKTVEQSIEQTRKSGEKNVRFQDQMKGNMEQISQMQKQPIIQSSQSAAKDELLVATLKQIQATLKDNTAHMTAMAEQHDEGMKHLHAVIRQNATQMKSLAESQARAITAFGEMLKEHRAAITAAANPAFEAPTRPSTPKRTVSSARSIASSTTETPPPVPLLPAERLTFRSPPRKIAPGKTLKTMKSQPNLNLQNHVGPGSDGERPRPPKLRQSLGTGEHVKG
ncbi:MAG: hypothetical protein M1821_005341 [Bathelium mastoideum]|nr:MAG: hypothetical protein M1821_005341 [Bathelium mastoideum]